MGSDEIESGEDLLLALKIFIEGFLALIDSLVEAIEELASSISCGSFNTAWVFLSFSHQSFPLSINFLELLRLLRQLGSDIIGLKENWFQGQPRFLHLDPTGDDRFDSLQNFSPLVNSLLKDFDVLRGLHTHQLHRLGVDEFSDISEVGNV